MLFDKEPSFELRFVASMPLNERLVLVVRVPFTEGEMFPFPFVRTGGSSALIPDSADKRCVKLRVDVGTSSNSVDEIWRKVDAVSGVTSCTFSVTVMLSAVAPTSS